MSATAMTVAVTLRAVDNMTRVIVGAAGSASRQFHSIAASARAAGAASTAAGLAMSGAGLALGAALALPVKQAIEFEKAMVGLGKQAGVSRNALGVMTGEGKARYAELTEQVFQLGRAIPMVHEDIAGMMEAGARMGVGSDKLAEFTRTAAMMASAFDAAPAELAEQMAKIANVMDIPIDKIGGLADVINYLDDQTVAKGSDIINVLQRVGGAAKMVHMSGAQTSALASTFLSMGTPAEVAATGINAIITSLSTATQGSKSFGRGLKTLGLDAQAIQGGMFKDAEGTIMRLLTAVKKLPEIKQVGVLTDLFGREYGDDVAKLVGGLKQYQAARDLAASPKASGSMLAEFNARQQQVSNQAQLLGNALGEVSRRLGTLFLPYLSKGIALITPFVTSLSSWIKANPALTTQLGLAAAGVAAFLTVAGGAALAIGAVGNTVAFVAGGLGVLSGGFAQAAIRLSGWAPGAAARVSAFGARLAGLRFPPAFLAALTGIPARLGAALTGVPARIGAALTGVPARIGAALAGVGARLAAFRASFLTLGGLRALAVGLGGRVASAFRLAATAARLFSLTLLANPITWVAAAVTVAALVIYKYWKPISGFFKGFFDVIAATWPGIAAQFTATFPSIAGAIAPVIAGVKQMWGWFAKLIDPVEDVGGAWEDTGRHIALSVMSIVYNATSQFTGFITTLWNMGSEFLAFGKNIPEMIGKGIMAGIGHVTSAISTVTASVRAYLPHSPAKVGPLRDIHRLKLVETMAASVRPAPLVKAVALVAGAARAAAVPNVRGLAPAVAGAAARGGGSSSFSFAPTIHLAGGASAADGDALKKAIRELTPELQRMMSSAADRAARKSFAGRP